MLTFLHTGVYHKEVADLTALPGAQHHLKRGILHHTQDPLGGLEAGDVCQGPVLQLDAKAGHTAGSADNVFLAADQLQDFAGKFLICHNCTSPF